MFQTQSLQDINTMVSESPGCLVTPPTRIQKHEHSSSVSTPSPLNLAPVLNASEQERGQAGTEATGSTSKTLPAATLVHPVEEAKRMGGDVGGRDQGLASLPPTALASRVAGNPLLTTEEKDGLRAEVAKAKESVKEDKAAAKFAVQGLWQGFVQPGTAEQAENSRGRGKGRGRGRGKAAAKAKKENEPVEDLPGLEEGLDADSEETLVLGEEPRRRGKPAPTLKPKPATAKATPKPKARSRSTSTQKAAGAKPKAKAKAKGAAQKAAASKAGRVRKAKRVTKARGGKKPDGKPATSSTAASSTKTSTPKKRPSAASAAKPASSKEDGFALKSIYHKHLRETIATLKEEGMPAAEALKAARSSHRPQSF